MYEHLNTLYFETTNLVYTRIQALTWATKGLSELSILEKSSADKLAEIIKNTSSEKIILANFKGVVRIDDHSMDEIYKAIGKNEKQLVILNAISLENDLMKLKKDFEVDITQKAEDKLIIIGKNKSFSLSKMLEEKNEKTENYIKSVLENTFTKLKDYKRLSSTPFYSNGEFNSKKIISTPKSFMWISLYLSDKLEEIIQTKKLGTNIKLISASLRGAIFTVTLGLLNKLDYITMDHFGPINQVYDSNSIKAENFEFIYIGDFVFGGTEIKITKTYIKANGGNLKHALVLGSLFDCEAFKSFELYQLSPLKEINDEADYKLFL